MWQWISFHIWEFSFWIWVSNKNTSLADWLSALGTVGAVVIALWQSMLRGQSKYKFSVQSGTAHKPQLILIFFNTNDFDIEIQAVGYYMYKHKLGRKVVAQEIEPLHETLLKARDNFSYTQSFYNPETIFGEQLDYVYVKPLILDSLGKWQSPRKRVKVDVRLITDNHFFDKFRSIQENSINKKDNKN